MLSALDTNAILKPSQAKPRVAARSTFPYYTVGPISPYLEYMKEFLFVFEMLMTLGCLKLSLSFVRRKQNLFSP